MGDSTERCTLRRTGDSMPIKYSADPTENLRARLLRRREIIGECWIWTGDAIGKPGKKYGIISYNKVKKLTHRISAMLYLGFDLKSPDNINHKCTNTLCFNPEHIYIGSQHDNLKDARKAGTLKFPGWAKARQIRKEKRGVH